MKFGALDIPSGIAFEATSLARALYATDASMYREQPLGVAWPRSGEEVQQLVLFAERQQIPLIPRAAGTSLAGQCVGGGLVVDVSRYMNRLLELHVEERWVRVQPGMVRDELNLLLKPHGLWFGPNTSTSNRCTLGGMAGNNSCGTTSIAYGTTRDHMLEMEVILSNGERVVFGEVDAEAFAKCLRKPGREGEIYRAMHQLLSKEEVQREVAARFPKASIHRRNTGYALDALLNSQPYKKEAPPLNLAKLLCGSEGTLAFTISLKLNLSPLPPADVLLFLPHFESLEQALQAVRLILQHKPYACELMDKPLLDCTRNSLAQQANRFFLQGDPRAVLIVECRGETREEAERQALEMERVLQAEGLGYAFPRVYGEKVNRVWSLRKAALGLLANLPGRARSIPCVEDTAVDVEDLPAYVRDFSRMMAGYRQQAVYYGHAGAGELHLRPTLDLYQPKDFADLRNISRASAELVARYRGSLSGEHGDGRLRAEFIPLVMGEKLMHCFEQVKDIWDPAGIFNPGKIVRPPPMDASLRISPSSPYPEPETLLDFSASGGVFGAAQKCTGSGDCRKSHQFAGNMCPSFQATHNEKHSTRGRANALREFLQKSVAHPFDSRELKEVLSLCLSCKACTSECPSGVNMTALKAEFLYQYYRHHRRPLKDWFFKHMDSLFELSSRLGPLRSVFRWRFVQNAFRQIVGLSGSRELPLPTGPSFFDQLAKQTSVEMGWRGRLYLFVDPFTNYLEPKIALAALDLLRHLGYEVHCPQRPAAGRALLSRGFLEEARALAEEQLDYFHEKTSDGSLLIGLEPSELLSFRDEYPRLVPEEKRSRARELAARTFLLEEFLANELRAGSLSAEELCIKDAYRRTDAPIAVHLHCHQKALSSPEDVALIIEAAVEGSCHRPVFLLDAGCCGMAGAFGYEHQELSQRIGNLRLFPTVKDLPKGSTLIATGSSCRQQLRDFAALEGLHWTEVLCVQIFAFQSKL